MLVLCVIPTYQFHNQAAYDLRVGTFLLCSTPLETQSPQVTLLVATEETKPLLFWQQTESSGSRGEVQALVLTTVNERRLWSLPLSKNFIRHSFSLPTGNPNELFIPAVLTMHETGKSVYLVVTKDPSPRFLIQNLTWQNFEVVERGTKGIHAYPQNIFPSHQVFYEPPTLAKQYPVVFDPELAGTKEKDLLRNIQFVSLQFRLCSSVVEAKEEEVKKEEEEEKEEELGLEVKEENVKEKLGEKEREGKKEFKLEEKEKETKEREEYPAERWTEPFSVASDSDKILSVPGGESIFVSTYKHGSTLFISLLPTGQTHPLYHAPSLPITGDGGSSPRMGVNVDLSLAQLVVCLDDESSGDGQVIDEILQVIADGLILQYNSIRRDGASVDFSMESLHINNMTEVETGDFAVTMLPRNQHMRRASLIESPHTPLLKLTILSNPDSSNIIEEFCLSVKPVTIQLENNLLDRLKVVIQSFTLPGTLTFTAQNQASGTESGIPDSVSNENRRDVSPLIIRKLVIEPTTIYLNAQITVKVLLSCNDSPFRFSRYQLEDVYSNWAEVSQTVTSRYLLATVAHVGWLLGSLELIGSPGTFIQNVGRGLRDLVTLPYEGLTRSPGWFLVGIGHGTLSFVHHLSSGALRSVTSMAFSLSRNMERLSMDPHHISYQAQQRQEKPVTHFSGGLISGASSFGLSLMSAVAGIVEQPMQSYHQLESQSSATGTARSLLAGVGRGLLGAVTKPVGGAMELVSQTGQGIMHGTGLARRLCHKRAELQSCTGRVLRRDLAPSSTSFAM